MNKTPSWKIQLEICAWRCMSQPGWWDFVLIKCIYVALNQMSAQCAFADGYKSTSELQLSDEVSVGRPAAASRLKKTRSYLKKTLLLGHCRTCGMCHIHWDKKVPGQPKKRRDACHFSLCTRHHEIIGLLELSPLSVNSTQRSRFWTDWDVKISSRCETWYSKES